MRRDVFQAIADPTRRAIINMVASRSLNLNSVAENFEVSRPAISKHIKILAECGLIVIKQQGRQRFCEAKLEKLNEVSDWVEQYRKFWTQKLDALENYLAELQPMPCATAKAFGGTQSQASEGRQRKRSTNKKYVNKKQRNHPKSK